METLRFLFTTSFYPPFHLGGDACHVEYLARALALRGHEVHVLFSLDAYRLKRRVWWRVNEDDLVYLHPLTSTIGVGEPMVAYTVGRSVFYERRFCELVQTVGPDVVHHHNVSLLGMGILKRAGRYLNLYTVHDHWPICQRSDFLRFGRVPCTSRSCFLCSIWSGRPYQMWRLGGFDSLLRGMDRIIVPSRYLGGMLEDVLGIQVIHIPNFAPPPEVVYEDVVSEGDYILFVGAFERRKGLPLLIQWFMKEYVGKIGVLVVVGEGELWSRMRRGLVDRIGREVRFRGFVRSRRKLCALYAGAKAVIVPSISPETSSLSAIEALSTGTPVVVNNIGALVEIIDMVDENLKFSWRKVGSLDRALDYCEHMGGRLRDHCLQVYCRQFSPEVYLERYWRLLGSI